LAHGKLSLLVGKPGEGKSQVSINAAATISNGGRWPVSGIEAEKGTVLILQAEDGEADTIIPRLMAAGADLKRVKLIQAVKLENDKERGFDLQADLKMLAEKVKELGDVKLVIIDPLTAYLGKTDSHNNAEVRSALKPISEFADDCKVAVWGITHFNKSGDGNAINRVMGSVAFTGAARVVHQVTRHPEDDRKRVFLPIKSNLSIDKGGYAFHIEATEIDSDDGKIGTSRIVWDKNLVNMKADDALSNSEEKSPAVAEAVQFLNDIPMNGPVDSKEINRQAKEAGISAASMKRAKGKLNICAMSIRDASGQITGSRWQLPLQRGLRDTDRNEAATELHAVTSNLPSRITAGHAEERVSTT